MLLRKIAIKNNGIWISVLLITDSHSVALSENSHLTCFLLCHQWTKRSHSLL